MKLTVASVFPFVNLGSSASSTVDDTALVPSKRNTARRYILRPSTNNSSSVTVPLSSRSSTPRVRVLFARLLTVSVSEAGPSAPGTSSLFWHAATSSTQHNIISFRKISVLIYNSQSIVVELPSDCNSMARLQMIPFGNFKAYINL